MCSRVTTVICVAYCAVRNFGVCLSVETILSWIHRWTTEDSNLGGNYHLEVRQKKKKVFAALVLLDRTAQTLVKKPTGGSHWTTKFTVFSHESYPPTQTHSDVA